MVNTMVGIYRGTGSNPILDIFPQAVTWDSGQPSGEFIRRDGAHAIPPPLSSQPARTFGHRQAGQCTRGLVVWGGGVPQRGRLFKLDFPSAKFRVKLFFG